jgi:hypothetical protein
MENGNGYHEGEVTTEIDLAELATTLERRRGDAVHARATLEAAENDVKRLTGELVARLGLASPGRPRGRQTGPKKTLTADSVGGRILATLNGTPMTPQTIAKASGAHLQSVYSYLSAFTKSGKANRIGEGIYVRGPQAS